MYNFKKIEHKWYKIHKNINFLKNNNFNNKKYYILNMFPYPSGLGLHIGHAIGYIFSDIIAKYKISKGYNVINPIGFDCFGLPAEQYAIKFKINPKLIIKKCIKNYIKQIKKLGIFINWNNIIYTHNKNYYKWTQWIFIKLFNSWYNKKKKKIYNIRILKNKIKKKNIYNKYKINKILNKYRLIYLKKSYVNWCPKLHTVLSNEEIFNGKSIRGEYDIKIIKLLQWHIRITSYVDKLLKGYKYIKWDKNIKNIQKKWIGKKKVNYFNLYINNKKKIKLYIIKKKNIKKIKNIILCAPSNNVDNLIKYIKSKYKLKILNILKKIYNFKNYKYKILIKSKINNFKINIYISNYYKSLALNDVYINYNNNNNKFFNIKNNLILNIKKHFKIKNIYFSKIIKKKYIYNLKDIVFSRQRYWGEPIPIYYKNNIPYNIKEKYLPLKLPYIKNFNKNSKLNNYNKWYWNIKLNRTVYKDKNNKNIYPLDKNTMPSFAGSNWYYLRFLDNNNNDKIINKKIINYWKYVDLYIGGIEHINGHLLYSRFCHKFLKDINVINTKEPFKQYINQGLILYNSYSIYKINNKNIIISYDLIKINKINNYKKIYINEKYIINNNILNIKKFLNNNIKYKYYKFKFNKLNKIICNKELEKMSKSKLNIINPNKIINKYGTDVFRLYLMFLAPFKKNKIWNIKNIKGIKRFLNNIWNYIIININNYNNYNNNYQLKILYNLIYKLNNNYKKLNFNTSISLFMKFFKKIKNLKFNRKVIKKYLILLSIFAPYICEELWNKLNEKNSIFFEKQPIINYKYLYNKKIKYIIMINNKKKIIIYIKKKNNNKQYIINKLKNNNLIKNYIIYNKKIIFIKNKILNILL